MTPRADKRIVWSIVLLCVAFEVPLLLSDRNDMEQYDYEYFSALWQLKDVVSAHAVNWWQDSLGFGSPLPIGFNLTFHPLIALNAVLADRIVIPIFQLAHLLLGTVYLYALLLRLHVRSLVCGVVLVLYVLGPPTFHYHYVEDWPVVVVMANLLPVVVYYVERFVTADVERDRWRYAIVLGLVVAGMFVWGHASVAVLYSLVVAVYAVLRNGLRTTWRMFAMAAVAVAITCLIFSPEVYRIVRHAREFDPGLVKFAGADYNLIDWFSWATRPFDLIKIFGLESKNLVSEPYGTPRDGFFTCVFFVAFFAALVNLRRVTRRGADPASAASGAFLAGMVLSTVKPEWYRNFFSASWMFRDPAVFFALLVYALAINDLLARWKQPIATPRLRVLATAALAISVAALAQTLYFTAVNFNVHLRRTDVPFRGDIAHSALFQRLAELFPERGLTVYQSFRIEETLLRRGLLRRVGAYASSDFSRAGYTNLVRRYFKNYSTDVFNSDYAYFYGHLPSRHAVIQNKPSRDFFGVSIVMVSDREVEEHEFPHLDRDMTYVGDLRVPDTGERILFYRNPTPLPRALAFAAGTLPDQSVVVSNVPDRLLGAQWQPVIDRVLRDEPVGIDGSNGHYTFTLAPHDGDRVVFFKQWYRPEWQAHTDDGTPLKVVPLYRGFVGVEVPRGVRQFALEYRPVVVQSLWIVSALTTIGSCGLIYALQQRRLAG